MNRSDAIGCAVIFLIFAALAFAVPAALHRHSCASLDVGTVEGCE